jgi:tetratricopeptide (TPR) repeat protein
MDIPVEAIAQIRQLYEQGLYVQAYAASQPYGPFGRWRGTAAQVIAGRLAVHVGSIRLGRCLHFRGHRADPAEPEAFYYYLYAVLERRGPLAAWKALKSGGEFPEAPARIRADIHAFGAHLLGLFRDFENAEAWMARADAEAPGEPWLCVERSSLLESEDRYDEALAVARQALALRPWYRPAVQSAAHVLGLLDRDAEAADLLADASSHLESGLIVAHLAGVQIELGRYEEARRNLDRYAALSPLLGREEARWLAARRSDVAYRMGDLAAAAAFAREAGDPFHRQIAERLAKPPPDGRRVEHPVPFIRQHHATCAPATLAAIGRFWGLPADHLTVAAAICYDGTPAHSERAWAESNGWAVREFTVTRESAAALLDRGVPFTLTTTDPAAGHLQAIIGYDSVRETLLVRDPFVDAVGECLTLQMLEWHRSSGPRGMAMAPRDRSALIEGLDLPDAALYDRAYRVQRALEGHDRAAAAAACDAMAAEAPGHRLTLQARYALAAYDADRSRMVACLEAQLRLFPNDARLQLARLSALWDLSRREDRLAILRPLAESPEAHPAIWRQYASELAADAREHEAARMLLRRALDAQPLDAGHHLAFAQILGSRREFTEALEHHRFAACLHDTDEANAAAYFAAARYVRRDEEAVRFLRHRVDRFAQRSSGPVRTLFDALADLERAPEAFAALDAQLALRPNDGALLLFAAEARGRHGDFDRAAAHLTAAEGRSHRTTWLRTAAQLASYRGAPAEALALWRQVADLEPLAMDAQAAAARHLAEVEGREAALEYLRRAVGQFPYHHGLHRLRIEWLREDGPAAVEPAVRRLLEVHPEDAWGRRELALALGRAGRLEEALAEAEAALRIEPANPSSSFIRGRIHALAGRTAQAREDYREAIRLSVDTGYAIAELIGLAETAAERREALAFVYAELVRQVILGEGLLAYRDLARPTLTPEEILATLREGLAARPDLWQTGSAAVRQLADMGRLDESIDLARKAAERFPLTPRVWLDLAQVCARRGDAEGEIDAIRHALRINPGWGETIRMLAQAHERRKAYAESRAVLEQAVARDPLDARHHGFLADALWMLGESEAAIARVEHAIRLDPGYGWAWSTLSRWATERKSAERVVALARDLTTRRAGDPQVWLMLARALDGPETLGERLAALDRATALDRRLAEAHDLRAEILAYARRFDEALAACRPPAFGDHPPLELRGRAAWIEAERGRLADAVRQMNAIVADAQDYYWGWHQLVGWYDRTHNLEGLRTAAEAMVRIAPDEPMGHGWLGHARRHAKDLGGASAALRRALELAPNYSFAAFTLFDLDLEQGDLKEAQNSLDRLQNHADRPEVLTRRVQLAARRRDVEDAIRSFRELAVTPHDDPGPIETAWAALHDKGSPPALRSRSDLVMETLMLHPKAAPPVGALWARYVAAGASARSIHRTFDTLLARGEIGCRAAAAWLDAAGQAGQRRRVKHFIRRHRPALAGNIQLWGNVIRVLVQLNQSVAAAGWGGDWKGREGVESWMLGNLVLALRNVGRDAEALDASRRALTLPPDNGTPLHAAWAAFAEAVDGDAGAAEVHLRTEERAPEDKYEKFLRGLARAALAIRKAAPDRRAEAGREARRLLRQAVADHPIYYGAPALRRAYRRCVWRIARVQGGFGSHLWALGRWIAS